jgi:hypothetical protein
MGLGQVAEVSSQLREVHCDCTVHRVLSHQPQPYTASTVRHWPQDGARPSHLYTFTVHDIR